MRAQTHNVASANHFKTGEMTGEGGDDGAAAPRVGGGGGGRCDPSADLPDGCGCRLDGTRAQEVT